MPPESPVRILFVGDLHLGRRASRLPDRDDLGSFAAADLGPLGAWRRVVQTALDHQVQAVALAGDLVDQDDDLFEARAHLEHGIRQLTDAGIAVVAVAGNHDTRIMPALAKVIDTLHVLGSGGTWTTYAVTPEVRLVGWSFPARHHTTSPLEQTPPPAEPGIVTLGLLHTERDVARSNYAPVSTAALNQVGYQGWALGHIHAPDPVPEAADSRQPFYLGSVTGSIPTETGVHGPVLATIQPGGEVCWERLALAPLRWEHVSIAVDQLAVGREPREMRTALRNFLLEQLENLELALADDLRALGLRVTLTGVHPAAAAIERAGADFTREELATLINRRLVFIEKITGAISVPVDLDQLARHDNPPGLLAREILALRAGDPAAATLLAEARQALAQVPTQPGEAETGFTDRELREHLARVGQRALNALLEQTEGGAA